MHKTMNISVSLLACAIVAVGMSACQSPGPKSSGAQKQYACVPFHDSTRSAAPQTIPGRIQNEYYDMLELSDADKAAGKEEGLCYHDSEAINNGSGKLNKTGSYQSEFRKYESPDISYTKFNNAERPVDDSEFNLIKPEANSLYLGWIAPGEWVNYTVKVKQTGTYTLTTVYTAKFGGHIAFEVDGKDVSGPLELSSTFNAADPIEWRQAHHWNKASGLGKIRLKAGKQVLKLRFLDQPVMNFDYMEFEKIAP
jgi:hypothetical protein